MLCLDRVRNAVFSFTVFSFCFRNDAIVPFFKIIEEDRNIGQMVIDYSISQTTLEEVFLNVSRGRLVSQSIVPALKERTLCEVLYL